MRIFCRRITKKVTNILFPPKKSQETGSALLISIFMAAIIMSIVAVYNLNTSMIEDLSRKSHLKSSRDEIAKSLLSHISNPELLKKAIDAKYHSPNNGNKRMYDCIHGTLDDSCEASTVLADDAQLDLLGYYIDYTRLILPAPDRYVFPEKKSDTKPNQGARKNCPTGNPHHVSCLLAGHVPGNPLDKVGYNFAGETGRLSACFPLEPVIYVKPFCGKNAFGEELSTCMHASDIKLAYQVIDRTKTLGTCEIPGRQSTRLGSFPKSLEFISMPRHALSGYQCNPGAFARGTIMEDVDFDGIPDSDGNIECVCRFPFAPIPGKRNEKGVLCSKPLEQCPAGTSLVERDEEGSPICKWSDELSEGEIQDMSFGTSNSSTNISGEQKISCRNKGWLQDLEISCEGGAKTQEEKDVGHSCLFFYGFIKMLNGKDFIPGKVPGIFYKDDSSKPCNALSEKATFGNPFGNGYDAACTATILALVSAGAVGVGAFVKKSVGKVVGKAAAKAIAKAGIKQGSKAAAKKIGKEILESTALVTALKVINSANRKATKESAEAAAAAAADKALKKGLGQKAVQKAAEKAAKRTIKVAQKDAAEEAGKRSFQKLAQKNIAEGAQKAGKEAAEKILQGGGENITKAMLKEAEQAVLKAAKDQAIKEATETVYQASFKKVAKVSSIIALRRAARESAEESFEKYWNYSLRKGLRGNAKTYARRKASRAAAKKLAEDAAKKTSKQFAAKKAAQESAKKAAAATVYASPFANFLLGDLPPALAGQALSLDIAIDAAAVLVKILWAIPFIGPALAIAAATIAASTLGGWHVNIEHACYPLQPPGISCTLSGTCYYYGEDFKK